jgi:sugar phosphate isomerase/epimerase
VAVNGLLARAGAFLVAPPRAAAAHVAPRPPELVAAVASPPDVLPVAGAVAAAVRRRTRSRTAVLCLEGAPAPAFPATRAAAALARRLADRGLGASACGTLCHVALPEDPGEAIRDVWRVAGAAGAPVVVALAGRREGFDGLLGDADLLVVAAAPGADPLITEVAVTSLERLGTRVEVLGAPVGVVGRRLAALGLVPARSPWTARARVPA